MSPAMTPGDRFLARRLRRPRRGRLVFFPHPSRPDFWLAKRIVGLPGETVVIDGGVSIDGRPLDEPWTTEATSPPGTWTVPGGHMFVLSDARHRTQADSRSMGPVPTDSAFVSLFRYRRGPT
jgi:signal peptidase I